MSSEGSKDDETPLAGVAANVHLAKTRIIPNRKQQSPTVAVLDALFPDTIITLNREQDTPTPIVEDTDPTR